MLPAFGDEWKRKINLGGVSSANTQAAILNRVQAERAARAEHKQRTESAIRIQAWYRGLVDARATRQEMRKAFNADVMGLTGLRCLVLIGKDDEVLGTWTRAVLQLGPGALR
jgi:ubiquitin-protein ligase E3 C